MSKTTSDGTPRYADVLAALHRSHDRLVDLLSPLGPDEVTRESYDDDWTIAQVASHLGSGAQIFELFVASGRTGTPAPGLEQFQPIWETWNAKRPEEQARDALAADAALLDRLDALTPDDQAGWQLDLFGTSQSPADLTRLRLSEHCIHTWDIAVALDPTEILDEEAVGYIIDNLPPLVERVAQGLPEPVSVSVRTTSPARQLLLTLSTEGGELTPDVDDAGDDAGTRASLELPAEAFVRLTYGRLDPDHTPPDVTAEGVDLDLLRRTFPGV